MLPTTFKFEYDFKHILVELINPKTGKLKTKYTCLLYMITLSLSEPLDPLGPPNQEIPQFNTTTLTSTSSTDGWLNYTIIQNEQPNIITLRDQSLFINYFPYNYDVIVNINKVGSENVDLRFMAINPFTDPPRATNMNDIFGVETSYSNIQTGQTIQFTITGQYQYFFINYPTTDFDITITIQKSNRMSPIFICEKNIDDKGSCRCFEIGNRGYIRIRKRDEHIDVPVYVIQDTQTSRTKYLYPEFGFLRDLFFNVTISNSLTPPSIEESITKLKLNLRQEPTIIQTGITLRGWVFYETRIDNNLLRIDSSSPSGQPLDQILQKMIDPTNTFFYRYRWDNSGTLLRIDPTFSAPIFRAFVWKDNIWTPVQSYSLINTDSSTDYGLSAGIFNNSTGFSWVTFGLAQIAGITFLNPTTFNIIVERIST